MPCDRWRGGGIEGYSDGRLFWLNAKDRTPAWMARGRACERTLAKRQSRLFWCRPVYLSASLVLAEAKDAARGFRGASLGRTARANLSHRRETVRVVSANLRPCLLSRIRRMSKPCEPGRRSRSLCEAKQVDRRRTSRCTRARVYQSGSRPVAVPFGRCVSQRGRHATERSSLQLRTWTRRRSWR
jgi:hypothetical protein